MAFAQQYNPLAPDRINKMASLKPSDLDSFDIAILAELERCNTTPLRVIGERVNLSTAAVQRRIRSLEKGGVIQGNVAIIDPEWAGKPITVVTEVHMERTDISELNALKAAFSIPEIQQCYYVTGDADFFIIMNVRTMKDYEDIARRIFYEHKSVKWFRTIVVMDRVKIGISAPFDVDK
ncbi:Lrp/AsnC family transcriptional regulator [Burkholderia sp. Bp9143]|uniref:Lrp/AsnC family transcriptional regulator n=1 Tax=Burkholderia sp. Bp9143 TaxID=2184574 RepID=UPI0021AB53B3|nr:Lrp/AsnC family transcriptional regulator [Burkholderia sp. Bp9143]